MRVWPGHSRARIRKPRRNSPGLCSQHFSIVVPGLDPGIHAFPAVSKTWMAGTRPAMTF